MLTVHQWVGVAVIASAAVAAAWYYTGGSRPYGYRGMGEISVFVFFGLVAVVGTAFVQTGRITASSVLAGAAVGSLACALLLVNNIRDAPKDAVAGKRTLAVFLGQQRSRLIYAGLMIMPYVLALVLIATAGPWVVLALAAIPVTARVSVPVLRGDGGAALIPALQGTSLAGLVFAVLLTVGLAMS
jgi:1,4-dihydroxy-2-naphthoate octaprenyltransferase